MENTKEIHYEVLAALEHLEQVYKYIDNAIALAVDTAYLQDVLSTASRNLGPSKLNLLVASDITETKI